MDRNQDVEVALYEENVGNLNYSTPTESRSSSPDRFLPVLSSQEPTQRRLEENPLVAINPRPDPEELSYAPASNFSSATTTWIFFLVILKLQGGPKSDEIWHIFRPRPQSFCSYSRTQQNIVILKKKPVKHRWLLYTCATFAELWPTNP